MKLCKDCKHYREVLDGYACYRRPPEIDLVSGLEVYMPTTCQNERYPLPYDESACGKSGRYWEAK